MQDVLAVQRLDPEEQLNQPKGDQLLVHALPVLLQPLQEGRQFARCVVHGLHSQYSMMMISSFSMRKNSW